MELQITSNLIPTGVNNYRYFLPTAMNITSDWRQGVHSGKTGLTDQKLRSILRTFCSEEEPFIEDQRHQITKETHQKYQLGNELTENVKGATEIPRQ